MNTKQNILLTCVIGSLSMGAFAEKGGEIKLCSEITMGDLTDKLNKAVSINDGVKFDLEFSLD